MAHRHPVPPLVLPDAGASGCLSYRSSLPARRVYVKVELPHAKYDDLATGMPAMVRQAIQHAGKAEAAAGSGGVGAPAANGAAAAPATAAGPQLVHYTHFSGCLTAALEYAGQEQLPADSELAAQLQQMLPEDMELVYVTTQDRTHSTVTGVWPLPVAIPASSDAGCSIDVTLSAAVLRQLPAAAKAAAAQQVRVVLATAAEDVGLSDGLVELVVPEGADSDALLQVGGRTGPSEHAAWQATCWWAWRGRAKPACAVV